MSSRDRTRRRDRSRSGSRSRSRRDKSRSRSRSRSRTPPRRKRRKRSGFDSGPPAGAPAPGGGPQLPSTFAAAAGAGHINPARMAMIAGGGGGPPPSGGGGGGFGGGFGGGMGGFGGANPMLAAAGLQAGGGLASLMNMNNSAATKTARKLYIGNLALGCNEMELESFFNNLMKLCHKGAPPGNTVVSVYLNMEKKFAFVEFRSMEEATAAMAFDHTVEFKGQKLKVSRPSDYNPMAFQPSKELPRLDLSSFGIVQQTVPNSPFKIFIGNLPVQATETEVRELAQCYGLLRAFHMVRDSSHAAVKGIAFAEYSDESISQHAAEGLNGIKIGPNELAVRIATQEDTDPYDENGGIKYVPPSVQSVTATKVLVLINCATDDDLVSQEAANALKDDINGECSSYGQVVDIIIPLKGASGAGKVFVEFASDKEALRAKSEVEGREFGDAVVVANFLSEAKFRAGEFD